MQTIDFRANYGPYYFPHSKEITEVDVPPWTFAMVDGRGNPNTSAAFREALEALFGVSYTLRFGLKKEGVAEYRVGPLEALWSNTQGGGFSADSKDEWTWTAMILQPDVVTRSRFETAAAALRDNKDPPALGKVRLERFHEGRSAQVLHVGPYSEERPTIERLHAFIRERGCHPVGRHHEIYLGDPRRSAPERLRTILRQPMGR